MIRPIRLIRPIRPIFFFLSAFLVALAGIFLYSYFFSTKVSAAWFDENWAFRKAVNVTVTSNASDISNLETLLTVDTSATGKFQSSCQDLRFTNQAGKLLPYYIDSGCGTASTKVWVLADLVPKNTTTYNLYMYYGNPTAPAASDSTRFNLFKNLTAYWTMNESSWNGTAGEVKDSSINAINGTSSCSGTCTVPSTAAGQYSNAGNFDGVDDYVNVPYSSIFNFGSSDFSIDFWIKPDTSQTGPLMGRRWTNRSWILYLQSGVLYWVASSDGISWTAPFNTGTALALTLTNNTWQHVVFQRNGSNWYAYLNGVQTSTNTSGMTLYSSSEPLHMGSDDDNGTWYHSKSLLDDVRIYSRALSSAEITQLYNTPGTIATTATTASQPTTAFAAEETTPGVIAYWKFNDSQGTSALDSSSSQNTGTLGGTTIPTWQTENLCISGKCLFFDGSTSKVTGSKIAYGIQTVSFWIRPNTIATQGLLNLDGGTHKISTNASGVISATGFSSPTYYINGVATATPTLVLNKWNHVSITTATGFNSTNSFTIGTDGTNFIKGFIDEVKFYNFARSAAQVKADFASKVNSASKQGSSAVLGASDQDYLSNGLAGYWKMDESSGTRVDSSGNGDDLTDNNTVTSNPGKFGNAGQFTAANSEYLSHTDNATLSMGNIDFTVATWVYLDSKAKHKAFISKYTVSLATSDYFLSYNQTSDRFVFSVSDGSSQGDVLANNLGSPSTGTWYHVVGWHDSVNKKIGISVNGSTADTLAWTTGVNDGTAPFEIGNYSASPTWGPMDGRIDDVRLYNRALSPKEVSDLYNWAPGPKAQLNMEEGQGASANDSSGNSNNGTVNSGTWTTGKYGKGVQINGSSGSNVSIPDFAY